MTYSPTLRPQYSPTYRQIGNSNRLTIPGRSDLIAYFKDGTTDSIGLSVSDYANIGDTLQPVFFSDPITPILRTYAELSVVLEALPSINLENAVGITAKGWAIYDTDTPRYILNVALTWFGLVEVAVLIPDRYLNTDHYFNVGNYA